MSTETQLITHPASHNGQTTELSVFNQINDPLAFIESMGKTFAHAGVAGVKTESEGKVMAMACLCERCSPFEINRRFHLMDGKLSKKSDVMLAEFRQAGGKFRWLKDGSDGKEASLELTYDDQTITSNYSIADAERAGLVRLGSGWQKNPGNMLRARATSNGVRMVMPEIAAGVHTPEEIDDERHSEPPKPKRTASDVKSRAEELRATADAANAAFEPKTEDQSGKSTNSGPAVPAASSEKTPSDNSVDEADSSAGTASSTPAPAAAEADTESPQDVPFTSSDDPAKDQTLMELDGLIREMGLTSEQFEAAIKQKNPDFSSVDKLTQQQAEKMIANIRAKLEAAKSKN